ncbi:MAG: sterol desaturase family protein [Bacteroidetes bacterium]|nr:sterol desaturase family protein [Bacteroidota bacterium]
MQAISDILKYLPSGMLTALFLNGTLITLTYFLFWKKFKNQLRNYKIQIKQRVNNKQIAHELKNAVTTIIVGSSFSAVVIYLSSKGYTKIYSNFSEHSPWFAITGFFMLLVLDDTWFYWCHRLLHHPKIFRYVHLEHHRSIDVNPFTSLSFFWIEPFLLTVWIFPVAFFIPIYAPVLGVVQLWGLLDNIKSHLGYEIYPANFNKGWLRFLTTSTHHNMHHSKFNGNYGVHFRIWDRLLGTEFEDYEKVFNEIQQRKKIKPKIESQGAH